MVDFDDSVFSNSENRRVFYVGASRAKNILDIVAALDSKQLMSIAEHLTSEKQKNPRPVINSHLKVKIC
jgi:superfamily I DNA/RNA helicase